MKMNKMMIAMLGFVLAACGGSYSRFSASDPAGSVKREDLTTEFGQPVSRTTIKSNVPGGATGMYGAYGAYGAGYAGGSLHPPVVLAPAVPDLNEGQRASQREQGNIVVLHPVYAPAVQPGATVQPGAGADVRQEIQNLKKTDLLLYKKIDKVAKQKDGASTPSADGK